MSACTIADSTTHSGPNNSEAVFTQLLHINFTKRYQPCFWLALLITSVHWFLVKVMSRQRPVINIVKGKPQGACNISKMDRIIDPIPFGFPSALRIMPCTCATVSSRWRPTGCAGCFMSFENSHHPPHSPTGQSCLKQTVEF